VNGQTPTGSQRVLDFLRDRRWHTLAEIEHECGVEGRSRLSDLRRQGHVLERRQNPDGRGKAKFSHRLVQTAFERSLQSEQIAEAEPSQTPSSALARAHDAHVDAGGLAVPPEPAGDDNGWRELFPPESAGETLPPRTRRSSCNLAGAL
jgi:hypothetical protein